MSWFVRNVRDAKWWDRGARGSVADLVGDDEAQVGVKPLRPRARPADVDVPLGGRPGGLPRPLRRGAAHRRRRGAAAAAVGLLPLPAERLAHDRRCRLRAVRDPRASGRARIRTGRLGRLSALRGRDEARREQPRRRRTEPAGGVRALSGADRRASSGRAGCPRRLPRAARAAAGARGPRRPRPAAPRARARRRPRAPRRRAAAPPRRSPAGRARARWS